MVDRDDIERRYRTAPDAFPAEDAAQGDAPEDTPDDTDAIPADCPPVCSPSSQPDQDHRRADVANAARFVEEVKSTARYCPEWKRWLLWDGTRWKRDEQERILAMAQDVATRIASELHEQARELQRHIEDQVLSDAETKAVRRDISGLLATARQVQTVQRIEAMIRLARTSEVLVLTADRIDSHAHLLNCPNGVIDLRTGELIAHHPDLYLSQITRASYRPEATSAALDRVVAHVMGNVPANADFLRHALGRSIFGDNALEKAYLAHGPGGSGKGTLFSAIKQALGPDYATTAATDTWTCGKAGRVRDDLARLNESRLVVSSEISRDEHLDVAVLKWMSGGDDVVARKLYDEHREFKPRLTLWLQVNDLPRVPDDDTGFWRRMVVIPFGRSLTESEQDPRVKAELQGVSGSEAVLAWLVRGAREASGMLRLDPPMAIRLATQRYNADMNPIRDFFISSLRFAGPDVFVRTYVSCAHLAKAYERFCEGEGIRDRYRLGSRAIVKRLRDLGVAANVSMKRMGHTIKIHRGVTLAECPIDDRMESFTPSHEEHMAVLAAHGIHVDPESIQAPATCPDTSTLDEAPF